LIADAILVEVSNLRDFLFTTCPLPNSRPEEVIFFLKPIFADITVFWEKAIVVSILNNCL